MRTYKVTRGPHYGAGDASVSILIRWPSTFKQPVNKLNNLNVNYLKISKKLRAGQNLALLPHCFTLKCIEEFVLYLDTIAGSNQT